MVGSGMPSGYRFLPPPNDVAQAVLAASTWARPTVTGVGLGIVWVRAVGSAAIDDNPAAVLDPSLLLIYAAVGVAAAVVLRIRLRHPKSIGSLL